MMRIIAFIVAAAAIFLVLWVLLYAVVHTLIIGFWLVLVVLLGVGLFRIGRWSRRA
ncbi:MAG TPA: hypothetical protein VMA95_16255 [Streptosporangiaceae bacterium]|nr:hypothetical protein [Streptosporangiaceae bacterium]